MVLTKTHQIIGIIAGLVIIVGFIVSLNIGRGENTSIINEQKNNYSVSGHVTGANSKITKSEIISLSINSPNYKDVYRYSEEYVGSYLHLNGEVLQVIYDSEGKTSDLRIATGECSEYSSYIYCDEVYYVIFDNYSGLRIMEGDILDIYGEYSGLYSYKSVGAGLITIPEIEGLYVEILEVGV